MKKCICPYCGKITALTNSLELADQVAIQAKHTYERGGVKSFEKLKLLIAMWERDFAKRLEEANSKIREESRKNTGKEG